MLDKKEMRRRFVSLALVMAASFVGDALCARPGSSAPPASGTLAAGLEALRTSDYAKAEQELAHVHGADAPAAQAALARVMLQTGRFADAERIAKLVTSGNEKLAAVAMRAEALFAVGKGSEAQKLLEANVTARRPACAASACSSGSTASPAGTAPTPTSR